MVSMQTLILIEATVIVGVVVHRIRLTLSGLHHQCQTRVDAVGGLLSLLGGCHRCAFKEFVGFLSVCY